MFFFLLCGSSKTFTDNSALHPNCSNKEASSNISIYLAMANKMLGGIFKVSKSMREKIWPFSFNFKKFNKSSYP